MVFGLFDKTPSLSPAELSELIATQQSFFLLDVRNPDEFAEGCIENANNIPLSTIANKLADIPQDRPVILYCRSGQRSKSACRILAANGIKNYQNLSGGIMAMAPAYPHLIKT